ncbi:hypothetical protein SASPL_156637 [Salvia splendens]|uniref:HORMA domain-containing protein n=1 Tax=Salvia splendens TaxID=180675 RepID=A0A8X8VWA9_SALSN|nr:hypothetical protein SASPL_156637 [Salvia splendens]
MVVAQKVKESEITEQDSLLLTRNLLRIAIFNISYIRGLFPEKYFSDKSVPALDMKIKKLMPMDAESRRLIDWMEKGVYDALQKKYLKTLLFCVCEAVDGPMIEEYSFSFSYSSSSDSQEVSMNINRSGTKKGGTFKHNSTTEITPSQMRSSACKMVRTLVQLMRTLDKMPEERTVLMKLLYYDDVTPMDYEPPFFRGCTDEEPHNLWTKDPLKMEVGRVNSKYLVLNLKVKSVLDPCEDENNDYQDDEISLGAESLQIDEDSESNNDDDQYIVAPVEKKQFQEDNAAADEDNTQDPAEDEHQLERVKEWIGSYHLETVDLTDVLSNFPDISVILIEDIMDMLVKENVVTKATGGYVINKKKNFDYEFDVVKEEADVHAVGHDGKAGCVDHMYMKPGTVRKLLDKMAKDGYVEATTSNRRLGKRVIQSDLTNKKLLEVTKILNFDAMDVDNTESGDKSTNNLETETAAGTKYKDLSTCGGLHSIGSDITRTRGRSDANMNDSTGLGRKMGRSGSTPTSRAEPAASRESFVPGADEGRGGDDMDLVMESKSTQDKRFRKTSTVEMEGSAVNGAIQLKRLGFVRSLVINAVVLLSNIYDHAKQNSGSLRPTVDRAEGAVTALVTPIYHRFRDVPTHLLVFLDNKVFLFYFIYFSVDDASHKFDEHAPPMAKNVALKVHVIMKKASATVEELVEEAKVGGPMAAVYRSSSMSKTFAINQLAMVWYKISQHSTLQGVAEVAAPTARDWSEKYNSLVQGMRGKGYSLFCYAPLVPVEEMAKAYKRVEASAADKEEEASSSSTSESDKE